MAVNNIRQTPTNIVIFGGYGDLSWRKLIPAFYNLFISDYMPDSFKIYAVHHKLIPQKTFEEHMLEGINSFSRSGKAKKDQWKKFVKNLHFFQGDFTNSDTYNRLKETIEGNEKTWNKRSTRLYYYSVAPAFIDDISKYIAKYDLAPNSKKDRIIVEKPFGTDLKSAHALNRLLTRQFKEEQIYRIDHYLGKEVVQNIIAFRFANHIFEPLWNRHYIDQIQITVAEEVSVGTRGNYYDQSGALRDMIQNHLLQLLSIVGMDCPDKYDAESIRNEKVKLLKKVRKLTPETIKTNVVRGQYTAGVVDGKKQVAYQDEINVPKDSKTETYVAAKFNIDNDRWKGVPFYLRTGKCLERQSSIIVVQFKKNPRKIFKDDLSPNRLIISIQPEQEITLSFEGKVPGIKMHLRPLEMDFTYHESFSEQTPEAYETLLLDAIEGDATQFMRDDQVVAAWSIVMPILNEWKKSSKDLKKYTPGSWGPKEADTMLKKDGFQWILLPEDQHLIPCKEKR